MKHVILFEHNKIGIVEWFGARPQKTLFRILFNGRLWERWGEKKFNKLYGLSFFFFIILWETLWNFLSLSLFATIIIIILFIIRYWVFFIKTLFFFYIHNDCKNNNSKNKKFQWVQWYLGNKWMLKKFTYFIPLKLS